MTEAEAVNQILPLLLSQDSDALQTTADANRIKAFETRLGVGLDCFGLDCLLCRAVFQFQTWLVMAEAKAATARARNMVSRRAAGRCVSHLNSDDLKTLRRSI
jgi:hypothetical protein